jgi:hypothetical protein
VSSALFFNHATCVFISDSIIIGVFHHLLLLLIDGYLIRHELGLEHMPRGFGVQVRLRTGRGGYHLVSRLSRIPKYAIFSCTALCSCSYILVHDIGAVALVLLFVCSCSSSALVASVNVAECCVATLHSDKTMFAKRHVPNVTALRCAVWLAVDHAGARFSHAKAWF